MPRLHLPTLLTLLLLSPSITQALAHDKVQISAQKQDSGSSTKKKLVVQLFSTISATKAEGMKNTLRKQGFPAFVNTQSQHTKAHYQVQIGPFASKDIAKKVRLTVINRYPQYSFLNSAILKSIR